MKTVEESEALSALTEKQIEVLELLVSHHSTKQIARTLRISPSAVDKRLYLAADRLGATDRRILARKYNQIKNGWEKHTCANSHLVAPNPPPLASDAEGDAPGLFRFNDATSFDSFAPWVDDRRLPLLEKLDSRAGPLGRIALVVATAALIAMLLLASFAIARTLGTLI